MNKPTKAPFIGWGIYSTPDGRGGVGSKSLIQHQVDIDIFDWQTEIAKLLKVSTATQENPHSLYNFGLRHDRTHGQMLFLRQAQHALEVNSSRPGTYISSFITTSQAYFKREAVVSLLSKLHELCVYQRTQFLDGQGKFKINMDQFRSRDVPDIGINLQNYCVRSNEFVAIRETKPHLWVLAQNEREIAQVIEAIVASELFKCFQDFYITSSPEIFKNAKLEPHEYLPASHVIGLGNGLISYLKEIARLQGAVNNLKATLGQVQQKHQQENEQKHQEFLAQLSNLKAQAEQQINAEKKLHEQTRANLEQQLQLKVEQHAQELALEQQRYQEACAQYEEKLEFERKHLNIHYSNRIIEATRIHMLKREQAIDDLINNKLIKYLEQDFVTGLGKTLVNKYTHEKRPDYISQARVVNTSQARVVNSPAANKQPTKPTNVTTPEQPEPNTYKPIHYREPKRNNKFWLILALIVLVIAIASAFLVSLESGENTTEIPPVQETVPLNQGVNESIPAEGDSWSEETPAEGSSNEPTSSESSNSNP